MTAKLLFLRQSLVSLGQCIDKLETELKLVENGSLDHTLADLLFLNNDISTFDFKFDFPPVPTLSKVYESSDIGVVKSTLLEVEPLNLNHINDVETICDSSIGTVEHFSSDIIASHNGGGSKRRYRSMSSASVKNNITEEKTDDDAVHHTKTVLPSSDVESLDGDVSVTTHSASKTYGKSNINSRRPHANIFRADSPSVLEPPQSSDFTPKRSSRLSKK